MEKLYSRWVANPVFFLYLDHMLENVENASITHPKGSNKKLREEMAAYLLY